MVNVNPCSSHVEQHQCGDAKHDEHFNREKQAMVTAPEGKVLVHVPVGTKTWSLAYRLGHHTDVLPFR